MKRMLAWSSGIALAAAAVPQPGGAQRGMIAPTGRAIATRPVLGAPVLEALRRNARPVSAAEKEAGGLTIVRLLPAKTVPWAAVSAMLDQAAMKGWTPLTNGATLGGAAVLRTGKNVVRVVVRAQDGRLYMTSIDGTNPGGQTGQTATSEPFCEASAFATSQEMLCGFLGAGGSAKVAWFNADYSAAAVDLGGHDAGARPTVAPAPQNYICNCAVDGQYSDTKATVDLHAEYVWDGGTRLFVRHTGTHSVYGWGSPTTITNLAEVFEPGSSGWRQVAGTFASPIGCDDQYLGGSWVVNCAVTAGTSLATFRLADLSVTKPVGMTIGKPAPVALSNRTAPLLMQTKGYTPVVIARGVNGRIYRQVGGQWFDEGGAARDRAQISCISNNEQPTCFIQGPDGRIWWKKLGTAAGL